MWVKSKAYQEEQAATLTPAAKSLIIIIISATIIFATTLSAILSATPSSIAPITTVLISIVNIQYQRQHH